MRAALVLIVMLMPALVIQVLPWAELILLIKILDLSSKKGISKRKSAAAELAKIDAAAPHITEKMRLGATLPNSPYKRYFNKEGKPIYNTDLGKTRGVPLIPSMGVRPIRSASGGFRDSGKHIGYLGILTPDDPVGARPISLVEISKQQQAHRAAVVADRQTEIYKELKKDALDQQPRGKAAGCGTPGAGKFLGCMETK